MLAEDRDTQDAAVAVAVAVAADEPSDEEIDELLVEEVSIDGMCGVY